MKKIILSILVIGVALALGCSRQNTTEEVVENNTTTEEVAVEDASKTTAREKHEGRATTELIRRLEKRVTFTGEQKAYIKNIAAQYDFDNLPKEQRREAAQKILAKIRAEVLTPEQIETAKAGANDDDGGGK